MVPLKWYVLQSHPRREEFLYQHVLSLGYDGYYPSIRVHPVNPRARKIVPYFPGYIFVHIDLVSIGDSVFKWMPYAKGLVSFGGEPAVLQDSAVHSISAHLLELNKSDSISSDDLKPGQRVEIHSGIFKGHEGIFDVRLSGGQRVRVLLNFLSQTSTIPVVLPTGDIKPKKE